MRSAFSYSPFVAEADRSHLEKQGANNEKRKKVKVQALVCESLASTNL
jgi:hypothetical protein